jgi:hypothetical protein
MTIGNRPATVRADGRGPRDLRPISFTLGVQKWAEVRVGDKVTGRRDASVTAAQFLALGGRENLQAALSSFEGVRMMKPDPKRTAFMVSISGNAWFQFRIGVNSIPKNPIPRGFREFSYALSVCR